ncbi:MAG: NusG domain II-containing protein [Spirochaetes bacterium]|nr:NusG domain II-containing protein [Spirochaetota bacterium]
MNFKKYDLLLLIVIIFLNILFFFILNSSNQYYFEEDTVYIKYKNKTYLYSLKEDKTILFKDGKIQINIENGEVWVSKSDCPNGICILMGKKKNNGECIYCVPNGLIIKVVCKRKKIENIDSISY